MQILSRKITSKGTQTERFCLKSIGGPYIAGLWEGDGHIVLPRYDPGGKLINTPCFCITFAKQELPLVIFLTTLHGGWLRHKTRENAIVWTITQRIQLHNIVTLLNGYLRSPKLFQFNLLRDYLNKHLKPLIPLAPLDDSPLGNNYWLSGFFDADGNLRIRTPSEHRGERGCQRDGGFPGEKSKQPRSRFAVAIRLEQQKIHKKTGLPFENLMLKIALFLRVNLRKSKHGGREYWCVESSTPEKLGVLVDYFNCFPLMTSKRNDYDDWLCVFNLIRNRSHLKVPNQKHIMEIKSKINRKRTTFNFNHL